MTTDSNFDEKVGGWTPQVVV